MKNPSDITSNPISTNKHLLGSLIQQQTYSDIQPQEIATEFKTLVLKHRTLQMTTTGDENHNETKKMKSFVLILFEKKYNHLHMKTQTIHKDMTVI